MSCVLNVFIVLIIIAASVYAYFYFTKKTGIICDIKTKPTCVPILIETFCPNPNLTCANESTQNSDCTSCDCKGNWKGNTCSDCGLKCNTSRNIYAPNDCSSCKFDGPYLPMCGLDVEGSAAGYPFNLYDKVYQQYLQLSQHNMPCGTVWLLTPYIDQGAPGVFRLANIGTALSPNATQLQVQTPDGSNKWQSLYVDMCDGNGYLTVAKREDAYQPSCPITTTFTWQRPGGDAPGYVAWISGGCRVDGSMYRQDMKGVTFYGNGTGRGTGGPNPAIFGLEWLPPGNDS